MSQIIEINNLNVTYAEKSPLQREALKGITLSVKKGEFRAIIGPQGSGKSTLLQVIAGLIPGQGEVTVCGEDLNIKKNRLNIWRKLGIIFQYPERQLFEDTIYNDIAYGPKNLGLAEEEVSARVNEALEKVNLDQELAQISPFKLSGGQQRRAAIAGTLAMRPQVLLLDEPTAGLDPRGKNQLMDLFSDLCKKEGATVVLVTHDMEEVALRADYVTVMCSGQIAMEGTPVEIFDCRKELKNIGLDVPFTSCLEGHLREQGLKVNRMITISDAERELQRIIGTRVRRQ